MHHQRLPLMILVPMVCILGAQEGPPGDADHAEAWRRLLDREVANLALIAEFPGAFNETPGLYARSMYPADEQQLPVVAEAARRIRLGITSSPNNFKAQLCDAEMVNPRLNEDREDLFVDYDWHMALYMRLQLRDAGDMRTDGQSIYDHLINGTWHRPDPQQAATIRVPPRANGPMGLRAAYIATHRPIEGFTFSEIVDGKPVDPQWVDRLGEPTQEGHFNIPSRPAQAWWPVTSGGASLWYHGPEWHALPEDMHVALKRWYSMTERPRQRLRQRHAIVVTWEWPSRTQKGQPSLDWRSDIAEEDRQIMTSRSMGSPLAAYRITGIDPAGDSIVDPEPVEFERLGRPLGRPDPQHTGINVTMAYLPVGLYRFEWIDPVTLDYQFLDQVPLHEGQVLGLASTSMDPALAPDQARRWTKAGHPPPMPDDQEIPVLDIVPEALVLELGDYLLIEIQSLTDDTVHAAHPTIRHSWPLSDLAAVLAMDVEELTSGQFRMSVSRFNALGIDYPEDEQSWPIALPLSTARD